MPGRDPSHWLYKFSPRDWMNAAMAEFSRAEGGFSSRDRRGGLASCRRAGGMAINAFLALAAQPDERWGRSFMDHLVTLQGDEAAPEEVRNAAKLLVQMPLPGGEVIVLRTVNTDEKILEATRTVMAHAMALLIKGEPLEVEPGSP